MLHGMNFTDFFFEVRVKTKGLNANWSQNTYA